MRFRTSALILSILLLSVAVAGCGIFESAGKPTASISPSPSPSATPAPIPTPTPTAPPVGTLVNGWVAGIPDYVPCFSCGKIDKNRSSIVEASVNTVFKLSIAGVTRADIDAYAGALEGTGYKVAYGEIGDTYTLTASKDLGYGRITLVITLKDGEPAMYALEAPV